MIQISFKSRIALNYIVITGLLIFAVFFSIYYIVKHSVYQHIDENITIEVKNHLNEITVKDNQIILTDKEEWNEREHRAVDVNPVFVMFLDANKKVLEKSPNLKTQSLIFHDSVENFELFDTKISNNILRQVQVPVIMNSKKVGYLIIAMSLTYSRVLLDNLFDILVFTFPLILVLLFFIARFFAGRSIKPINSIINTSRTITRNNLKTRITLPTTKDELYILSQTINNLLDRLEDALEREKQFASDASHELRTPLTVIKGTLEVLIRKSRDKKEYEDKINFCVREVDNLNILVDQLLLLARFENQRKNILSESVYLNGLILDVLTLNSSKIKSKKIAVKVDAEEAYFINSDNYLIVTIFRNVISNAIKYSHNNGQVSILLYKENGKTICKILDNGIGIDKEDLEVIFNPFFRSKASDHPEIKGIGLGLSIVKRLSELLHIDFKIDSKIGEGTTVTLTFVDDLEVPTYLNEAN
ncbi:HAMP domain-containing sensor histidine kinase [Flavobacterium sp. Fl-77]|uniref:histidine kinase n=1 Tax=Flavobacterium flavipigmentatum TaxID=2893884 RepID=A0AAJ2SC74_9FLAO|nr:MULTISPECIES: HAMP domain-containing sensor histidine kinase [unclassified Flavobacterium]MDX6183001.1 HAMP domain-containing sensor histidine kinase [Flavobacterium sp. Fl-33]MDX6186454.1 HAMP domain-containing sensor histidine kinase [Flavobacterium sp. Fl-77]UFH37760.1 HAMP domain-containing histidine kinase [Flavobacterium sp. F-70]